MLLTGFLLVAYRKTIRVNLILSIFSLITIGIILSILYFHIFPVCYIRGEGQTDFKIASEFIIIGILGISLILLVNSRSHFSRETYRLILFSIALTILSELCFTFYFSNYDFLNKLGHVFKVLSFYMIYKANIYKGFNKPIETFFNELKQNEEKIKEYSKELEKQVATRNKFFSIISHDLKNPFTVLMGYSELLLLKHKEISEEVREKYIANLYDSSKLTFNLLENLLTWSRTQTKTIPFEPVAFDITEAIKKNISLLGKNAELKDISLENKSQIYQVWADIEMIKTVIRNLLTNAIKFTPRGGLIKIETHVADGLIITSIADSGVGMSEEKVNSLFHLDKTSSAKGTENESGTGLGLILCYEFVQKNQGKIWVESEPGRGTKISFSLKKA